MADAQQMATLSGGICRQTDGRGGYGGGLTTDGHSQSAR